MDRHDAILITVAEGVTHAGDRFRELVGRLQTFARGRNDVPQFRARTDCQTLPLCPGWHLA
jgi:hypothetical protein